VDASTENLRYSPDERGRNPNYRVLINGQEQTDLDESSDDNWVRVSVPNGHALGRNSLRIHTNVAGNNHYRIEAKCTCGVRVIRCPIFTVKRRIWIVPFVMRGVRSRVPHLDSVQDTFRALGLEIATPPGPYPEIEDIEPSYRGMRQRLVSAIRDTYPDFQFGGEVTVRRLSGYVFPMCFVDSIATRDTIPLEAASADLRRGNPLVFTVYDKLWKNMGDGRSWLHAARFVPSYGFGDPIEYNQTHFTESIDAQSGDTLVEMDIDQHIFGVLDARRRADPLLREVPDNAPGTLQLAVNIINAEWAGFKFQQDILAIATKLSSTNRTREEIVSTILHEMGHILGLVPNGEDLDRSPMWYDNRGHRGNHCSYGVRQPGSRTLPDSMIGVNGDCIMFGGGSANSFCRHCEAAIRKVNAPALSRVLSEL